MPDDLLDPPGAVGLALSQRTGGMHRNRTVGPPAGAAGSPGIGPPALLELALEAGELGQWTWDSGSDRVSWTPRLRALHALPAGGSAAPFADFEQSIVPEDRARVRAALEDAVRTGRDAFDLEYRVAPAGGTERRIAARVGVFPGARGGAACAVAMCADVTARRAAEACERALREENARLREQASRAEQAKSGFLAVMSHELRTPLNAIMGYTELWLLGVPAPVPDRLRVQVERVRRCAQHLLRLIEEVLTFARIEADREEPRLERTDMTALGQEVASAIRPLAGERGLDFVVDLPAQAVHVETDGLKVRQILFNLLSNAVKFTNRGEIRFGLERAEGEVRFEVRDTGIGIAPEHLERVFEPFWQVESARTRRRDGTGLGLSVARRLARLLGGDVTVTSVAGVGSTFRLRLPEAAPARAGAASDSRSLTGRRGGR